MNRFYVLEFLSSETTIMHGESPDQAAFFDEYKEYETNTYNVMLDNVVWSMNEPFIRSEALYRDFACFEPKRFADIRLHGLPDGSLKKKFVSL